MSLKNLFTPSVVLMFALSTGVTMAQQSSSMFENMLRSDGTIRTDGSVRASFALEGWGMRIGPNGAPQFLKTNSVADPDDQYWASGFSAPAARTTYALAFSGQNVYVGGYFGNAGGVAGGCVAWFDGTQWRSMGGGMDNTVYAVAVMGSDVYVGGDFSSTAGDTAIKYFAKWNGSAWSNVGGGVRGGSVNAIAVWGTDVYIGGTFTSAGNVPDTKLIAKWNGSTWEAVGGTQYTVSTGSPYIRALHVANNKLYVGGRFEKIVGKRMNGIAEYNGVAYDSLGTAVNIGVNGVVSAITSIGTTIYAGGDFSQAGQVSVRAIAQWTGSGWDSLQGGLWYIFNDIKRTGFVYGLAAYNGELYAAGIFAAAGNVPALSVAKWSGTTWSVIGDALSQNFNTGGIGSYAAATGPNGVYFGGDFGFQGSTRIDGVGRWNGSRWFTVGNGLSFATAAGFYDGSVRSMALKDNDIVVGGGFYGVGGAPGNLVRWDGTAWNGYGTGVNGSFNPVEVVVVANNKIYIGGNFTAIGPDTVNNLAVWNGSSWSSIGTGVNDRVYSILVRGDSVFVGGDFTFAGETAASKIALWNGSSWSALGSGANGSVTSMAFLGNTLYVGGWFTAAGGTIVNGIATWNGSSWSALGSGVNGFVQSIAFLGSDLYVAGGFEKASGLTVNSVARWDGSSWSALGNGILGQFGYGYTYGMTTRGSDVIVGGDFTIVPTPGDTLRGIAVWNGEQWKKLGSGIAGNGFSNVVNAIVVRQDEIYVGGAFGTAGDKQSSGFAKWSKPIALPSGPTLNSPADAAIDVVIPTTFTWSAAGDGVVYQIQVATDQLFTNVVFNDSLVFGTRRSKVTIPGVSQLYWRVRGWNSAGAGPWSSVRAITTAPAPPSAPTPQSPAHNAANQSTSSYLQWSSVAGATRYWVQASADSLFTFTFQMYVNDSTITTTSAEAFLGTSTRWFWRLKAGNVGGWSDWSAVSAFNTSSTNAPSRVELSLPVEGATNVPRNGNLTWNSVSGSNILYRLQVSTDSLFGSLFYNDTIRTLTKSPGTMAATTTYFWRVNATNAGGTGFWAIWRRFTTGTTTGTESETEVPRVFALQQNYPNPFNPSTNIAFSVDVEGPASLVVYDQLGRVVAELFNGAALPGTAYNRNLEAERLSAGMYLAVLRSAGRQIVKKMLLIK